MFCVIPSGWHPNSTPDVSCPLTRCLRDPVPQLANAFEDTYGHSYAGVGSIPGQVPVYNSQKHMPYP